MHAAPGQSVQSLNLVCIHSFIQQQQLIQVCQYIIMAGSSTRLLALTDLNVVAREMRDTPKPVMVRHITHPVARKLVQALLLDVPPEIQYPRSPRQQRHVKTLLATEFRQRREHDSAACPLVFSLIIRDCARSVAWLQQLFQHKSQIKDATFLDERLKVKWTAVALAVALGRTRLLKMLLHPQWHPGMTWSTWLRFVAKHNHLNSGPRRIGDLVLAQPCVPRQMATWMKRTDIAAMLDAVEMVRGRSNAREVRRASRWLTRALAK